MDTQRAKEIRESENLISVTYQGNPVYIEQIDEQHKTANIYVLENPQQKNLVPLDELHEK
ncbi:H-type small acid-soluble spore protein [Halobacillus seohaensis]|uniref:Small, acid-soluble spore protein H n=1 Tax=Halobacillus seohaensis TaxID=447421 RepID=A0ABW2EJW9_9BACI